MSIDWNKRLPEPKGVVTREWCSCGHPKDFHCPSLSNKDAWCREEGCKCFKFSLDVTSEESWLDRALKKVYMLSDEVTPEAYGLGVALLRAGCPKPKRICECYDKELAFYFKNSDNTIKIRVNCTNDGSHYHFLVEDCSGFGSATEMRIASDVVSELWFRVST